MEHTKEIQEIFRDIKKKQDTKIEIDIEKLVNIGELPEENDFGDMLAYYRRLKKLTQPELGKMLGLDRHAIKSYEHNQRFPQNLNIIKDIMKILDMPKDMKLPKYLEVSLNTKEKLKQYLESHNISRRECSIIFKVSLSCIDNWVSGRRKISPEQYNRLIEMGISFE